jgi:hypothetical protein
VGVVTNPLLPGHSRVVAGLENAMEPNLERLDGVGCRGARPLICHVPVRSALLIGTWPHQNGQSVRVRWENEVAAIAAAALAIYFLSNASSLAHYERLLFRYGDRAERFTFWSYRFGSALLLAFAVVLGVGGVASATGLSLVVSFRGGAITAGRYPSGGSGSANMLACRTTMTTDCHEWSRRLRQRYYRRSLARSWTTCIAHSTRPSR